MGWITADGVHRVSMGSEGEQTKVWCGFLGTSMASTHPLLDALPPTSDRKALARDAAAAIANALSSVRGRDALEAPRI